MDHILENRFLNKEGASKEALKEHDEEEVAMITGDSKEEVQFQVFESFVKEKHSLLGYVRAMVIYSARKQVIDEDTIASIYEAEKVALIKDKVVANDQDLFNFKNRIIIIVRRFPASNRCRSRNIRSSQGCWIPCLNNL